MRPLHQDKEIELLKRCLRGSSESFTVIVGQYQSLVCGITFALTGNFGKSEELAQETFVQAWKSLRQLQDLSKFKPWLCQITRNVVQNWRRQNQRDVIQNAVPLDIAPEPTTWAAEPSQVIIREEEQTVMNRAIEAVPEKYRLPLILFYRENKSYREVAQLIDLSENATRQRIARARAMLKEQVTQMVETNLAQTKPGKTFTGIVLASITGVAMKGAAITVAAETGGWALSSGLSGLTLKIVAATAGLTLLAGVAYTLATKKSPKSPVQATPPVIVTEDKSEPRDTAAPLARPSEEMQDDSPVATTSPVAAEAVEKLAEQSIKKATVSDPGTKMYRLHCIDRKENPVAGVWVYLLQMPYDRPPLVWGMDRNPNIKSQGPLTSDANGLVEFPVLEDSNAHTIYRAAYAILPYQSIGIWQQTERLGEKSDESDFMLTLHESKTVLGQVLVPTDYSMESIKVDIMLISVPEKEHSLGCCFESYTLEKHGIFSGVFEVPVDETGHFEVPNLPADGVFTIRARAPRLAEAQMHVQDAQRADFIKLNLAPEGIIEGRVRFADTHAPVANRKVFCRTYSTGGIARSHAAITDEEGNYSIEGLGAGIYEVTVGMETYPPSRIARAKNDVEAISGGITDSVDFELETGTVVTGIITSQDSNVPIEGVLIGALTPAEPGGVCINSVYSDPNGQYSLRLPLGDSMLYIGGVPQEITYPGEQGRRLVSVASTDEILDPVDYSFASNSISYDTIGHGIVSGRVFDEEGLPIAGILITEEREYLYGEELMQEGGMKLGRTDEEGRFRVEINPSGKHKICVGGYEWSAQRSDWFEIKADEIKELDEFYLDSFVLDLSVQILDEEGYPLAHVNCAVGAENYFDTEGWRQSDTEGMIFIEHLPDSEISLLLACDGYEYQSWNGYAGDPIEIVMKRE